MKLIDSFDIRLFDFSINRWELQFTLIRFMLRSGCEYSRYFHFIEFEINFKHRKMTKLTIFFIEFYKSGT